jgi:flavin-dependent dehydrogenase
LASPVETAFDVIVLGAGPGGSVTASVLARQGWRTALAGRVDARPNVGECLPPGVRPLLEKAGVWEEFLRSGHVPSVGIRSIWGSPERADRDFLLSPYYQGWHIDRSRFDAMCRDGAARSGAESIACLALKAADRVPEGWQVTLSTPDGDRAIAARLVVDATGRASAFARRTGAKRRSLDQLGGVAGYFALPKGSPSADALLLVEAVESGWWYTAPLPGGKLIAVLMTDTVRIQREGLKQTEKWVAALHQTIHQWQRIRRCGGTLLDGPRILQADSSFLDRIVGDHWLAAGDAAAAFDPLSSQGILSAIGSGFDAARTVAAWLRGDEQAPRVYAREARRKYAEYLAHRTLYYRLEQRWPESPFWKSRHREFVTLPELRKVICA